MIVSELQIFERSSNRDEGKLRQRRRQLEIEIEREKWLDKNSVFVVCLLGSLGEREVNGCNELHAAERDRRPHWHLHHSPWEVNIVRRGETVCVAHRGLRLKEFIVRFVMQPRRRYLSFRLSLPTALMEYTSNSTGDSGSTNSSAGDGSLIRVSMTHRRLEKFPLVDPPFYPWNISSEK